ncbi:MAG: two-component regulator propeller domain-containing protein, partial [Syntrophales bacterium]
IFQDRSGNLWVGTQLGRGLNKLEHRTVKFYNISKNTFRRAGLNDDVVWSICADNESRVWIGTFKGGLNLWDRRSKKFSYLKAKPGSLSDNHIRAIKDDGKGNLLIGTYSGGLNIFNKQTKSVLVYKNIPGDKTSLGANQVQSVLIDREGNYWIGTFGGGLNKVRKEDVVQNKIKFERYTYNADDPFSISDNRVYTIYEDSEGVLWIGTFGGGLNKFDKSTGHFISYKNLPGDRTSLSDNRVMAIHEDGSKNLWIGTYGGGLNLFDKKKESFQRFNDKSRLKSSVVYGILEDNFKQLWMSTDNGLFKLDIPTKQFTQYDQNDGLQNLEFSGGAYYKSEKGEMFYGGIAGFNYFFPDSVIDNAYVPPVAISSIRIFDEPLREERDTITLSYDQNFFSFEFAALDYTNSSDNQYAFMLEGFDKQWRFVDSRRRIANYTNLSPGEYVFSVIGSNNDGVWNYEGKNVYIIILPPFWKRWWFILLTISLAVVIIYYIAAARYRSLLAIEKLKSKLSADLHDNVGSGLTEISILSELTAHEVQNLTGNVSHNLSAISEKARQLIDSMSDIVWMVNPQRDSFYDLIVRLKDTYSDLMMAAGISYKTANLEKLSSVKLPMEYKQNLFLIFKEALNNSIKHSKCKKISLEADITRDILTLVLFDDGNGIETNRIDSGNGIRNMKARAKTIGGKLEIVSGGEGTSLKFSGKFNTANKLLFIPFK